MSQIDPRARFDFGDVHYLCQAVAVAARRADPAVIGATWRDIRRQRRHGHHQRFTFADYLDLRRRRRRHRR